MSQKAFQKHGVARHGDRYRIVVHVQLGQFVQMVVHCVGKIDEQIATSINGMRHPFAVRVPSGADRSIDFDGTGKLDRPVRPAGCRVDVLVRTAGGFGDPVPADKNSG